MQAVWMALGGLVGIIVGVAAGLWVGTRLHDGPPWRYWFANVVGFLAGVAVAYAGLALDQTWLAAAGIGILGGTLTGLKYGFGRVVSIPRVGARSDDGAECETGVE